MKEKYFLLGGTGVIGTALKHFFDKNGVDCTLLGRKDELSKLILNQSDTSSDTNVLRQSVLVYMLPGSRQENKKNIDRFLDAPVIRYFDKIVFISSYSAKLASNIHHPGDTNNHNDPYGKRYCELRLLNHLNSESVLIIRPGLVIGARTMWNEILKYFAENNLHFPSTSVNMPFISIESIYRYIIEEKNGIINLPKNTLNSGLHLTGVNFSKGYFGSLALYLISFPVKNPMLGLRILKHVYFTKWI